MELTANLVLQKTKVDNLSLVKNLNLWGTDITDIAIVKSLPNIEVLALSVNHIRSLRDIGECTSLKELYLRKNDVTDLSEVEHLTRLPNLTVLWLCDNPCAAHPLYRTFTIRCCPHLKQFDNIEVSPQEVAQAERMTPADVKAIMGAEKAKPKAEPKQPAAAAPSDGAAPPQQHAPQPAAPSGTNRQTQKAILSAMLTLMAELNAESLNFLAGQVNEAVARRK
jgi:hypothetical protein